MSWEQYPEKPGTKSRIENPHPSLRHEYGHIVPSELFESFDALRNAAKAHGFNEMPQPTNLDGVASLRPALRRVLDEAGPAWTTLRELKPTAQSPPASGCTGRSIPSVDIVWPEAVIDDLARRAIAQYATFPYDEGVPAFVAYAILATLLNVSPVKIRNTLDNFQHPRRSRRRTP